VSHDARATALRSIARLLLLAIMLDPAATGAQQVPFKQARQVRLDPA